MKINRLVIENFKSIERIELVEPNPFTVFVGPNGSGKSTIFEALEFATFAAPFKKSIMEFGGPDTLNHRGTPSNFSINVGINDSFLKASFSYQEEISRKNVLDRPMIVEDGTNYVLSNSNNVNFRDVSIFRDLTRLFVGATGRDKRPNYLGEDRLTLSASNMEGVLKRVLSSKKYREEIIEWLSLFIPGFRDVEIRTDTLSGSNSLLMYEQNANRPFSRYMLSDGTYNILALLTAVYQSDEPQFLCIEEPENGLHPQVVMALVDFFRQQCKEKGHYIWLNTHSESLVRKLTPNEIILVDKREGATKINQVGSKDFYDLQMDEAWLTGALGGGLPW